MMVNALTATISFWGKGGVGKTTITASLSVGLARMGYKVLAVSTDPTPSLKEVLPDHLECGVNVIEVSSDDVIRMWKERFGNEVYTVISSILPVDEWIIDYVAGAPGIADEFMMYYIMELSRRGEYDYIVWDTPATGGSIRLLRIEHELYTHLGDAAKLYLRVKSVVEKLRRGRGDPLKLIIEWRRIAEDTLAFLASDKHYPYIIAIPSRLGVHVTRELAGELSMHNVRVRGLVINMVKSESVCMDCEPWVAESLLSKRYLAELERVGLDVKAVIPFIPEELRGWRSLLKLYKNYLENITLDFVG